MDIKQIIVIVLILIFINLSPASAIQLNEINNLKEEGTIQSNHIKTNIPNNHLKNDSQNSIYHYSNDNLPNTIFNPFSFNSQNVIPGDDVWGNKTSKANNWAKEHPWAMVGITCAAAVLISLSMFGAIKLIHHALSRPRYQPLEMGTIHDGSTADLFDSNFDNTAAAVSDTLRHRHRSVNSVHRHVNFDNPLSIEPSGGVVGRLISDKRREKVGIKRVKPKPVLTIDQLNNPELNGAVNRLLSTSGVGIDHPESVTSDILHDLHACPDGIVITDAIESTRGIGGMMAEGIAQKMVNGKPKELIEVARIPTSSPDSTIIPLDTARDLLEGHNSPLARINPLFDRVSKIFSKISQYPQQLIDELFIGSENQRLSNIPDYHESIPPSTKRFNLCHLGVEAVEEITQDAFGNGKHLHREAKITLERAIFNFGQKVRDVDGIFKMGKHGLIVEQGRVGIIRTTFENYFETKRDVDHFGNYIRTTIFQVNAELSDGTLPLGEIRLIEILQSPMIEVMFPDGGKGLMPDERSLKRVMSYSEVFNQPDRIVNTPKILSPPKPPSRSQSPIDVDSEVDTSPTAKNLLPIPTTTTTTTTTTSNPPSTTSSTDIPISQAKWSYTPKIIGFHEINTLTLKKEEWYDIIDNLDNPQVVTDSKLFEAFNDPNLGSLEMNKQVHPITVVSNTFTTQNWNALLTKVSPFIKNLMEHHFGTIVADIFDPSTMGHVDYPYKGIEFLTDLPNHFKIEYIIESGEYNVVIPNFPQTGILRGGPLYVIDHFWNIQILDGSYLAGDKGSTISQFRLKEFRLGAKWKRAILSQNNKILEGRNIGAPSFNPSLANLME